MGGFASVLGRVGFLLTVLSMMGWNPAAVDAAGPLPKLPANSLPVPLVSQATPYSCGPAALLAVFYYWGNFDGPESELYPLVKTSKKTGTRPDRMAEVATKFGLEVEFREDMTLFDLRKRLDDGDTVILDFQAWKDDSSGHQGKLSWADTWDEGHYAVLVGMDSHFIYLMDPSAHAGYGYLPILEFLERWHDFETIQGKIVQYHHLGIVARGKRPIATLPGPLVRIN